MKIDMTKKIASMIVKVLKVRIGLIAINTAMIKSIDRKYFAFLEEFSILKESLSLELKLVKSLMQIPHSKASAS